jgi:predicted MFS family arabinose efflux permease
MNWPYRWKLAALIFCVSALNYGDRSAITAVFPALRREFGLSDLGLAATGSAFLWSYGLCSPLAGLLADRYSRSRLVVWSLIAWSLVTLATAAATNIEVLFSLRLLLGVSEALYLPAAIALIADHHPVESRAKAIGVHMAGLSTGMVAGGVVSGYLATAYSWRTPAIALGVAGLVLAAICHKGLHDAASPAVSNAVQPPSVREALAALSKSRAMLVLSAEILLMGIGTWSLVNWLPLYFHETYTMDMGTAALFGTVFFQVGSVLGVVTGGFVSDWATRRHSADRMLLFGVFYLVAAPALLLFLAPPQAYCMAAAVFLFALFRCMGQVNSNPLVCEVLPQQVRSVALGIMNALACLAGAAGVLASGWLKGRLGLAGVFASITWLTVGCGIALVWSSRRRGAHGRQC